MKCLTVNISAGKRSSAEAGAAEHSRNTWRQQRRTRDNLSPGDSALSMPSNSAISHIVTIIALISDKEMKFDGMHFSTTLVHQQTKD